MVNTNKVIRYYEMNHICVFVWHVFTAGNVLPLDLILRAFWSLLGHVS